MPTKNYNFPEIDPSARFDGANDINHLAEAIDTSMKQVELLGKAAQFKLPVATTTELGGVKPDGTTVKVAADGTISTEVDSYRLPPASRSEIGGVKVPADSGFNLAPDGALSIDPDSVTLPPNSVGTAQIAGGAVTGAKLAAGAVTREKMSAALQQTIDASADYVGGNMKEIEFTPNTLIPGFTESTVKVFTWGPCVVVRFINAHVNVNSSTTEFNVGTATKTQLPSGLNVVGNGSPNVAVMLNTSQASAGYATIDQSGTIAVKLAKAVEIGEYVFTGNSTLLFF